MIAVWSTRRSAVAVSIISLIASILTPVLLATPADAAVTPKLLVVGDSISHGSAGDWTWRYRLAKHLQQVSSLDFVGPVNDLWDPVTGAGSQAYRDVAFDRDHASRWGGMLADAANTIGATVAALPVKPDVVLVELGLNDLYWGGSAAATSDALRRFVTNARSARPTMVFLVADVPMSTSAAGDSVIAGRINAYNTGLPAVVQELTTAQSPVLRVPLSSSWVAATDTYDGTHPNARGEYVIAKAFADVLSSGVGIGAAFGALPTSFPPFPAPSSLSALAGNNSVALTWTPVPGARAYYIYQRNVSTGQAFSRLPYPVAATSFRGGLLNNGQTYEWRVSATRYSEEGAQSAIASATPTGPVPAQVTGLAAVPLDGGAVLSWTLVDGALDYWIYQRDATAGAAFTRLPYPVPGPVWTAGLLVNQRSWEFKVSARNLNGEGALSAAVSVVPKGAPPNAPASLTATPGSASAMLAWSASTGASGYYIEQRNATLNAAWTRLPYAVTGTSFNAGLLTNGQLWQFRVVASNAAGTSAPSPTASTTPQAAVPSTPSGLTAVAGDTTATLSWRASSGATGYYVYQRDVTAGGAFARLPYAVTGTQFTAGLLANGHTWEFKVTATAGGGESTPSNTVAVVPRGPVPGIPTNLAATAGNARVQLTWRAVPGATGYDIYQRDVTAGGTLTRLPYSVSATTFDAQLLTNGHVWEFAVRAVNANGASDLSSTVRATPVGPPPPVPTGLTLTASFTSLTLAWTTSTQATGYYIYIRDVAAGSGFRRLPVAVTSSPWTVSLLQPDTLYELKLRSANLNGESDFSATVSYRTKSLVPTAPSSVTAEPFNRSVRLTWTSVADATQYRVFGSSPDWNGGQLMEFDPLTTITATTHTAQGLGSARWTFYVSARIWTQDGPRRQSATVFPLNDDYGAATAFMGLLPYGTPRGQCTSFAAHRMFFHYPHVFLRPGGPFYLLSIVEGDVWHAKYWDTAALSVGYGVDSNPRVGDIAQTEGGDFGHVAFVAAVLPSGLVLEEYNYNNPSAYGVRRSVPASSIDHFIHL